MPIRPAAAADAASIARLFRRVRDEAMAYLPVLHTPDQDLAFFQAVLARADVWLAEEGDCVVGFVARSPGWIDHLYVDASVRGRGVGSSLLRMAMQGQGPLRLWVFERNEGALRLYMRHGFVQAGRTDGAHNEEREPDILMHRPALAPS